MARRNEKTWDVFRKGEERRASADPAEQVDRVANSQRGRVSASLSDHRNRHGAKLGALCRRVKRFAVLIRPPRRVFGVTSRRDYSEQTIESEITASMSMLRDTEASAGLSDPGERAMGPLALRLVLVAAGLGVVALLAVAGLLWVRHGTTIFFDTLAAGIATCF